MVDGERDERRRSLRRLEDCLELLEAAGALGATLLTPGLAAAVGARLPGVVGGMAMTDAIAAVAGALETEAGSLTLPPRERRHRHRRPAFDPRLLIDEVLPPRV